MAAPVGLHGAWQSPFAVLLAPAGSSKPSSSVLPCTPPHFQFHSLPPSHRIQSDHISFNSSLHSTLAPSLPTKCPHSGCRQPSSSTAVLSGLKHPLGDCVPTPRLTFLPTIWLVTWKARLCSFCQPRLRMATLCPAGL